MSEPTFPPLMSGQAAGPGVDPFAKACAQAALGSDSGVVVHRITPDILKAAIILAPEVPLDEAVVAIIACGLGFQNALGALAPPEVAVHLTWPGGIEVNGAACGRLSIAADLAPDPNWLVVGLQVPLLPAAEANPGDAPDQTCLYEEGCADVSPVQLLESWARHSLHWLNRLQDGGTKALHTEWRGLAKDMGEAIDFELAGQRYEGTFMGVDENFGMLLRSGADTKLVPLAALSEAAA